MSLFDQISSDIKAAMLARDKQRLEALRGVKKEFLEAKTAKGSDGDLPDETAMKILVKMVKQRKDSAQIYIEQNRPELAEGELAEAKIIEEYLPATNDRRGTGNSIKSHHSRNRCYFGKRYGQSHGYSNQTTGRESRRKSYLGKSKRITCLIYSRTKHYVIC